MSDAKRTVLIVDDEPDVVTYLSSLLEDHGYATLAARDGNEALEKVRAAPPDLITLDITMPEASGVGFYRAVKQDDRLKRIPVVIVTGISEDFRRFISTRRQVPPPEGYVSKPIDAGEMLKLVASLTA